MKTSILLSIALLLAGKPAWANPPMIEMSPSIEVDGRRLDWDADRFRIGEYVATGTLAAGAALGEILMKPPQTPNWTGGILLDDAVRSALRIESRSTRDGLSTASDVLLYAMIAMPTVGDAGIAAGLVHRRGDVAWQILMIDAESFAVTSTAIMLTKNLVGRERPYNHACATDPSSSDKCGTDDRNRSFVSGHSAMAFTGAGLVCAHHQNLPLYGGGVGDTVACVSALTAATATGVLRIMTDNHYTSDVLAGAAVGIFSGYVLPNLLHYHWGRARREQAEKSVARDFQFSVAPVATTEGGGVTVIGTF